MYPSTDYGLVVSVELVGPSVETVNRNISSTQISTHTESLDTVFLLRRGDTKLRLRPTETKICIWGGIAIGEV